MISLLALAAQKQTVDFRLLYCKLCERLSSNNVDGRQSCDICLDLGSVWEKPCTYTLTRKQGSTALCILSGCSKERMSLQLPTLVYKMRTQKCTPCCHLAKFATSQA